MITTIVIIVLAGSVIWLFSFGELTGFILSVLIFVGVFVYGEYEDYRTAQQIQTISAFHNHTAPSQDQIRAELKSLRRDYGISQDASGELLITAARSGVSWDQQKKLVQISIRLDAWNRGCGGKC